MKRIAVIVTILALSLGAHAVVAKRYAKKAKVSVYEKNGVVHVSGANEVYMVAAREGEQVYDVQMTFGVRAKAQFQVSPNAPMSYDVFRVVPMGTFESGIFKPCYPKPYPNPNDPSDCTPLRWPPALTARFLRIKHYFGM